MPITIKYDSSKTFINYKCYCTLIMTVKIISYNYIVKSSFIKALPGPNKIKEYDKYAFY